MALKCLKNEYKKQCPGAIVGIRTLLCYVIIRLLGATVPQSSHCCQNDIVQLRLGMIGKRLICFQVRSLVS